MFFENRFFTNEGMLKEYINKVLCRKMKRTALWTTIMTILFLLLKCMLRTDGIDWESIWVLALFFFSVSIGIMAPRKLLKQMIEYDARIHNGERPECVVTFGEDITLQEGKQSISVAYNQIQRMIRLKTCTVLMFTKESAIMLVEDKFTVGDRDTFEVFILEKCKNIKRIEIR